MIFARLPVHWPHVSLCMTMTLLTSDMKGKVMGLKHRWQNRKVVREELWEYSHRCCSQIPGSGLFLLMGGDSCGARVRVQPAQGSCREKRSCAGGKDEPELSSLCRAGESDALLWKQAQCVKKPCRRRLISMQMWGQKVVARLWPAPVNARAQHGPRLGCAVCDISACKCLAEWGAGVVAKCCCGVTYLASHCLWRSELLFL